MTREKNADYWEGYNAEAARHGRPGHFESLAQQVSRALGRDNGRKQRIVARSPEVFSGMDADEYGRASSIELAARELKELGIEVGDNDPLAILDAHHAGRQWARDSLSGKRGSARDAAEGGSFMDKYLGEG